VLETGQTQFFDSDKMQVVFPVHQTKTLSKVLESFIDGADTAFMKFQPDRTVLTSIDSQRRSMHTCTFLPSAFTLYTIPIVIRNHRINVTKLLKVLQSDRLMLVLSLCESQLVAATVKTVAETPQYTVITDSTDDTVYLQVQDIHYKDWDSFYINSLEFSTQVLELSTGGTCTEVAFSPSSLEWKTQCETGKISFVANDGFSDADFQIVTRPQVKYNNWYFTKYLKQLYTLCLVSKNRVRGYLQPGSPLVFEFVLSAAVTVVFITAPVVPPVDSSVDFSDTWTYLKK
jgi:hypothetical protein